MSSRAGAARGYHCPVGCPPVGSSSCLGVRRRGGATVRRGGRPDVCLAAAGPRASARRPIRCAAKQNRFAVGARGPRRAVPARRTLAWRLVEAARRSVRSQAGKLVSPGRVLSRCWLRRAGGVLAGRPPARGRSPRRAAPPLCSCPPRRAVMPTQSRLQRRPARATFFITARHFGWAFCGRATAFRLPKTDAEPRGRPRIRSRQQTRPKGQLARRKKP